MVVNVNIGPVVFVKEVGVVMSTDIAGVQQVKVVSCFMIVRIVYIALTGFV